MNFWKVAVWVRANGVVVSWLSLQTASNYIPHPYHIYTNCFSSLICCWWTYGCTLTLLYRCKCFWKVGVWVRPNGVVVSWLSLRTASEGIPHPYHIYMYTKCFSTLMCCGWTYGYTLTLLYLCRWGWIFGNWGVGESEWCCDVRVEATNSFRLHPTFISYVYKVC